jgi:hypothetical protein
MMIFNQRDTILTLIFFACVTSAAAQDRNEVDVMNRNGIDHSRSIILAPNDLERVKKAAEEHEVAWDEFNHQGQMLWGCRRVKSGEFVSNTECANKKKVDIQWPTKATPGNWRPPSID